MRLSSYPSQDVPRHKSQLVPSSDSQPIPHIYSSAQANTAHVFRCGIGQIKCAELVKRVTQINAKQTHHREKTHFNNELDQINLDLDSKPF